MQKNNSSQFAPKQFIRTIQYLFLLSTRHSVSMMYPLVKRTTMVLLFTSLMLSCTKDMVDLTAPECVNETIDQSQHDDYGFSAATTYLFQGNIVYVFTPSWLLSDAATVIFDGNCNLLCSIDGYSGPTKNLCNGVNFYDNATKQKVIWSK